MRTSRLLLGLALLVAAHPADAQKKCAPVELLYDDKEELSEKRADNDKDCRIDEIVKYQGGKPARAEKDTNGDGRMDTWITYDAAGQPYGTAA